MFAAATSCLISKSVSPPTYLPPTSLWTSWRPLRLSKLAPDCSSWPGVCYLRERSTVDLTVRSQRAGSQFFLPEPRCHHHGPLDSYLPPVSSLQKAHFIRCLKQWNGFYLAGERMAYNSKSFLTLHSPAWSGPSLPLQPHLSHSQLCACPSPAALFFTLPQVRHIPSRVRFRTFE